MSMMREQPMDQCARDDKLNTRCYFPCSFRDSCKEKAISGWRMVHTGKGYTGLGGMRSWVIAMRSVARAGSPKGASASSRTKGNEPPQATELKVTAGVRV